MMCQRREEFEIWYGRHLVASRSQLGHCYNLSGPPRGIVALLVSLASVFLGLNIRGRSRKVLKLKVLPMKR